MKWITVKLGDLCEVVTKGTTPRTLGKSYTSSGIPFLRAENLQGDEIVLDNNTLFIDEETNQILARSRIYPGDVLISIAGTIGRGAIVSDRSSQMNCNQAVAIIRVSNPLDNRFLLYWLKTTNAQTQMYGARVTLTISNLSLGQIKQLQIPLPPLSEQRRIVEILDQADTLRKKRAEADAKAKRILPALFIKMFGDPATNLMGWEESSLGEFIIDGPQNGLYKHSSSYGNGTPILRIDSFYDGAVDKSRDLRRLSLTPDEVKLYQLRENDIVINRVNSPEYLGKSALIPKLSEPTVFESNIMKFSVNTDLLHPVYLIQHLQSPAIKQQIFSNAKRAINQSSINQGDVKSFTLLLPPPSIQHEFAALVMAISKITKNQASTQFTLNELFKRLLQRAFSGDLTAKWREAHMSELLAEMEQQAKIIGTTADSDYEQLNLIETQ